MRAPTYNDWLLSNTLIHTHTHTHTAWCKAFATALLDGSLGDNLCTNGDEAVTRVASSMAQNCHNLFDLRVRVTLCECVCG